MRRCLGNLKGRTFHWKDPDVPRTKPTTKLCFPFLETAQHSAMYRKKTLKTDRVLAVAGVET